ncbi:MAG: hypothetical protein R3176_00695 [Woeseiaceae bacterium]|nr:hypothetical protein [Woeseiaceae bacterium]
MGAWAIFATPTSRLSGPRPGIAGLLALVFWLLAAGPAGAMTAQEAFADGNRLFRDDLYWAALLRYRQAADAGMVSPLLDYNTGIAHYRAGQHIRARAALLDAARAPELRVLSQYNLGLNAYAAGNTEEALDWFRQARDQEENPKIRRLAIEAISRLQKERRAEDTLTQRAERRQEERRFTDFEFSAKIGFGNDDNVYRTPDQNYVDFSNPNQPLVTPEPVSGAYMPVDLGVKYWLNILRFESFFTGYRLVGRLYQDKELDNANEYSHELRFGNEFERETETRKRRLHSAFTIAQHDETYFDPDDGTPRAINGESIDDRLNYLRYGPQIAFRQTHDKLSFGFAFKGQLWDYEDTGIVPEYDHEFFEARSNAQYRFTRTSLLRLNLRKSSRRYSNRPSFDLDGNQFVTNPSVRYDYLEAGLLARQRITRRMWFGFEYRRTERTDRYLGYNDYSRDHFGFEFSWLIASRMRFELDANYRVYDFPNAYAFHNPAAGPKTLESGYGRFRLDYKLTRTLSLVANAEFRELTSTDTRIAYERNRYSLGITWQQ